MIIIEILIHVVTNPSMIYLYSTYNHFNDTVYERPQGAAMMSQLSWGVPGNMYMEGLENTALETYLKT